MNDRDLPDDFKPRVLWTTPCAEQSKELGKIATALAKAQGVITGAAKGAENPFFKSKYADLAACWEACRGPLSENEIAVIQTTEPAENGVTVVTTLAHSSGEWIRGRLTMSPDKPGPQAIGSCITYARRYALAAIVGLAQIDDDAESATFHMSKPMETKIRKALDDAMEAEDHAKGLETWLELDDDEKQFIWHGMNDRFYRSKMNAFLKAALDAANGKSDPSVMDPLPQKVSEKDARREKVRANG